MARWINPKDFRGAPSPELTARRIDHGTAPVSIRTELSFYNGVDRAAVRVFVRPCFPYKRIGQILIHSLAFTVALQGLGQTGVVASVVWRA